VIKNLSSILLCASYMAVGMCYMAMDSLSTYNLSVVILDLTFGGGGSLNVV